MSGMKMTSFPRASVEEVTGVALLGREICLRQLGWRGSSSYVYPWYRRKEERPIKMRPFRAYPGERGRPHPLPEELRQGKRARGRARLLQLFSGVKERGFESRRAEGCRRRQSSRPTTQGKVMYALPLEGATWAPFSSPFRRGRSIIHGRSARVSVPPLVVFRPPAYLLLLPPLGEPPLADNGVVLVASAAPAAASFGSSSVRRITRPIVLRNFTGN